MGRSIAIRALAAGYQVQILGHASEKAQQRPLRRARELEGLGFLHMTLQESLGTNYGSAVKLIG